jgi:hypothetical protein
MRFISQVRSSKFRSRSRLRFVQDQLATLLAPLILNKNIFWLHDSWGSWWQSCYKIPKSVPSYYLTKEETNNIGISQCMVIWVHNFQFQISLLFRFIDVDKMWQWIFRILCCLSKLMVQTLSLLTRYIYRMNLFFNKISSVAVCDLLHV